MWIFPITLNFIMPSAICATSVLHISSHKIAKDRQFSLGIYFDKKINKYIYCLIIVCNFKRAKISNKVYLQLIKLGILEIYLFLLKNTKHKLYCLLFCIRWKIYSLIYSKYGNSSKWEEKNQREYILIIY